MNLLSAIKNTERNVEDVISLLQQKVASLVNRDNEKHLAFNLVTANWNVLAAEAEGILSQFTGVEGDEKDALDRLKTIVSTIKGGTQTVLSVGLNDLPDAVKTPGANGDAPAALPSLSEPVLAENINVTDTQEVVVEPKTVEDAPDTAVDVAPDNAKTSIQNGTKTDTAQN